MFASDDIKNELTMDDMPNESFVMLAEYCGLDVAASVLENMPGLTIFVPANGFKKFYNRIILKEFDGTTMSIKRLALKYKTTEGNIREILKNNRVEAPVSGQIGLF
jgi:Mor family transcriptional regulator